MTRRDQGRLTLRAIEIFVAVVEEGSFALGARRLNASTSSVSQQITNLEAALRARLIDRSFRPVSLTPAGYVFQRRALAILDEAARAQSELAELEMSSLPELRLAMVEEFNATITPELVIQLSQFLPDCNIIAHMAPSHENLARLEARGIDMAVAADLDSASEWVEQHPLLRDPYVLVTARGLLGEDDDPITRLMDAPLVRFASTQLMGRQVDTHLRRLRLAPPRRCEFESNDAVMAAVARLRGWTIATPASYLHALKLRDMLEVRPLPFQSFVRVLSLHARRGILGNLPSRTAGILRALLSEYCVEPALLEMPWLVGSLRILGENRSPSGKLTPAGY